MDYFLDNILPIFSFVVSLLALGSVLLAWMRINQVNKWNKVKVTAEFVDTERAEKLLDEVDAKLTRLQLPLKGEVSSTEAEQIRADADACKALNRYLKYLEQLAAVINIGAIDEDLAYQFMVCEVIHAQERFALFIRQSNAINNDAEIMVELEKLANRWRQSKNAARTSYQELHEKLGLRQRL
ncbi:DUF4760 domain-containing protein [Halomonas llamarensis]|uniref:DUF4760 domain-containing protein n=1 Tax=Halomonas llamarensis TaxID=2945104 RepID=A0ABT0SVC2_9GAMM|nr:DUF4760 domain-containing protein [Halomonas llamarensis]MCL7931780.1 DUF4760 domain-containing protein [Halomonas llamarensis]